MKTMILAVGMLLAGTQTLQNETALTTVSFEEEVHDFGTIEFGALAECTFKITNTGNVPLVLTDVHGSCGCTTPKWSKEPVMPGKQAIIDVHYNSNHARPISRSVTATGNFEGGSHEFRIKGMVKAKQENTGPEKRENGMTPQNTGK